jgi:RimJ/RimL family protein N-acetyltransferase
LCRNRGSAITVDLRPLAEADLLLIEPWFSDADTRRYLGGPEWPAEMLRLAGRAAGAEFRGATQTGALRYLARIEDVPVGYIDCGTFDRCAVWDGTKVVDALDVPTAALAFAVDPQRRRQGIGAGMINALTRHADLRGVELFEAGVEPDNLASQRCLQNAGFTRRSEQPDFEGMLYYRAWRRGV